MRPALSCLLLIAATGEAAAERFCYGGTETRETDGDTATHALVVVRELDRKANEIRQQSLTDADSERERTTVYRRIDAKTGTFDLDAGPWRGKGTLEGTAWSWTGYRATAARASATMTVDGKVGAKSLSVTTRAEISKRVATQRWEATAFDCKELDQRKRALDPASSPTATRACYAGTATASTDKTARPLVLVQVVDRKRIEIRYRFGKLDQDRVDVLTIDGDKVTVDRVTPAKLTGKPGAWTGYAWTSKGAALQVAAEGTLGGKRVTHTLTMTSATNRVETLTLEATKFDCAELAAKRAAL